MRTLCYTNHVLVFLRDSSWLSVRNALTTQKNIRIPLGDKVTLSVEFLHRTYNNPDTGLNLQIDTGYVKCWHPRKPGWLKDSHVQLDRIIVTVSPSPDPTAYREAREFMELIGEALETVTPIKDPGAGNGRSQWWLICRRWVTTIAMNCLSVLMRKG
jgi:hypothetical protein